MRRFGSINVVVPVWRHDSSLKNENVRLSKKKKSEEHTQQEQDRDKGKTQADNLIPVVRVRTLVCGVHHQLLCVVYWRFGSFLWTTLVTRALRRRFRGPWGFPRLFPEKYKNQHSYTFPRTDSKGAILTMRFSYSPNIIVTLRNLNLSLGMNRLSSTQSRIFEVSTWARFSTHLPVISRT